MLLYIFIPGHFQLYSQPFYFTALFPAMSLISVIPSHFKLVPWMLQFGLSGN
jgi:hypothetical protein